MNWVDFFIAVVLVVTVAMGYKSGLFRSITTFLGLVLTTVFAVNHADWLVTQIEGMFAFSPSMRYVFCFFVLFFLGFGILKLLGHYFYKLAKLTPLKYPDMIGGSIFGMFKGLLILSLIFIMFIFFPGFQSFNDSIDQSVMAPHVRRILPLTFELTGPFHPESGTFAHKIKSGILGTYAEEHLKDSESLIDKQEVLGYTAKDQTVINNIDRYFEKDFSLARKGSD